MTIWAAISCYSLGHIIILNVRITASDCVGILVNQVHPMVQMSFPNKDAVFKMTVRLCTQKRSVSV